MPRSFLLLFAVSALAVPSIAFADQFTCSGFTGGGGGGFCATQTGGSALTAIDHHDIYTWGFNGISLAGKTISTVTLAFKGISNWDSNTNRLDLDLLDTPGGGYAGGGASSVASQGLVSSVQVTTNGGDIAMAQWNDDFLRNNTNSIGFNGGGDWRHALTAAGSAAYGLVAVGTNLDPDHSQSDLGHANTVDSTHSFNTTSVDYTYTFSGADLTTLATYINNGGDFAFGFNPDCHYFDTSVTMQISLGNASSPVPEPGSIFLLGTAAFFVMRKIRQKRSNA